MRMGVIVAVVLLVMVLLGSWWAETAFDRVSAAYVSAAEELRVMTEDGAWQRAGETLDAYQARWAREAAWLRMVVRHAVIDDVSQAMDRLAVGIRRQDPTLCALGCMELGRSAAAVHDGETLSLANLL